MATKSAAIQKNLHIEKSNTKNEATPPPAPVAAAPTIATAAAAISNIIKPPLVERPSMNEHNRRLMAALAPKPIEGVENWGIPDEPDTPCDPERAVSYINQITEGELELIRVSVVIRKEYPISYH